MAMAMCLKNDEIEKYLKKIDALLRSTKVWDTSHHVNLIMPSKLKVPHITVQLTADAYVKMTSLVMSQDTEIGWHGTVTRNDSVFTIDNILVYPQTVSGVLTDTDPKKYADWLYSHDTDTFSRIRFHGHSHVNMQVTESNKDIKHWSSLVNQLEDDMFYIFLIMNKLHDYTIYVYDMENKIIYDKDDIEVEIILSDGSLADEYILSISKLLSQPKLKKKKESNIITDPFSEPCTDSLYQYIHGDFPEFMEGWEDGLI